MGAWNVSEYIPEPITVAQLKERFMIMKREAVYDHGHDPYNGSWSTIDSVRILPEDKVGEVEADNYCLDNSQKWDYAGACRVMDESGKHIGWAISGWAAT